MIKSMTGYGKAECAVGADKYLVEIRSVNGKNADISLKTSLIPRDREMAVRQMIADKLGRGNIDMFITLRKGEDSGSSKDLDTVAFNSWAARLRDAAKGAGLTAISDEALLLSVLRMPDVVSQQDKEMGEDEWQTLYGAICQAVEALDAFRTTEGESLRRDVLGQVDKIESYVSEVEKYEKERIDTVRERIRSRIAELGYQVDGERLEQEMIFYIEKLDINEEKVRLRQHCRYFRETAASEPMPGKKLGFIAQEMGREINTMGSKANHAEIQKWVVRMKDELEKIKEQSLNIL
ncbi:MAG: YicC family protein [Bacteroidales bacterium]|nr:YicC family protein [Bacteroidales bacterium]